VTHGRTIRLLLSTPFALAAMVTAVAGTLGLGSAAIHTLEPLPAKFAEVSPSGRLAVNTSRYGARERAAQDRGSRSVASDGAYLASGTANFLPVADRTDPKQSTSPAVLASKPSAQTKIHAVTSTSKSTTDPATETAPHYEPIKAVLETLPWEILHPHLVP
jgi:hypothetical protein